MTPQIAEARILSLTDEEMQLLLALLADERCHEPILHALTKIAETRSSVGVVADLAATDV